jgi:hypothetical protein
MRASPTCCTPRWITRRAAIARGTPDAKLQAAALEDQQFLIAHSTRSYYGSTQLLEWPPTVLGRERGRVLHDEYASTSRSITRLELKHNPWVVRNLLDNFVRYYSYCDEIKLSQHARASRRRIVLCHDMGAQQLQPIRHEQL